MLQNTLIASKDTSSCSVAKGLEPQFLNYTQLCLFQQRFHVILSSCSDVYTSNFHHKYVHLQRK